MNTVKSTFFNFKVNDSTPESCKDNKRFYIWAAGPTTDSLEVKLAGSTFGFISRHFASIEFDVTGLDMEAIEGRYFAETRVGQWDPDENYDLMDHEFQFVLCWIVFPDLEFTDDDLN